jgi:hypothetical protein
MLIQRQKMEQAVRIVRLMSRIIERLNGVHDFHLEVITLKIIYRRKRRRRQSQMKVRHSAFVVMRKEDEELTA